MLCSSKLFIRYFTSIISCLDHLIESLQEVQGPLNLKLEHNHQQPSPLSVLEVEFSNETCNSPESWDGNKAKTVPLYIFIWFAPMLTTIDFSLGRKQDVFILSSSSKCSWFKQQQQKSNSGRRREGTNRFSFFQRTYIKVRQFWVVTKS